MHVVIVEDQGLLRDALAEGLTGQGVHVTAKVQDADGALAAINAAAPDVAILDIRLPPTFSDEGLVIAEQVRERYPEVGLLVLSSYAEVAYAERLLHMQDESRAIGYLLKERVGDLAELTEALRRVAAGEVVIDPLLIDRLMRRRRAPDPLAALSPHERRILALVAEGRSNLGIARELGNQISTVEKHVSVIADKLRLPAARDTDRRHVNMRVLAALVYLRSLDQV
ncbi:DNA-binding NarL/FixJ family response regulator [Krasilnikovia cinnamomea]|uniref:DNA-binding NarL/FixJ family response regulator n=1 Tax=Krasilnikovia cinnamomea TaxID=349313 RepID=A0A4Q7ZFA8_9ACTN|nr:response regulator transcription factor [Krasilnikovia cinnamomea]RZU49452.1 DNA-binding NarL/FixJ family response regulator [Krasilnikovia cinnamomea]